MRSLCLLIENTAVTEATEVYFMKLAAGITFTN